MRSHETPPALLIKDWLDLAIHIAAEHKTIMALFNSIGVVGIVVFSVLGVCWADYWPGDTEFQTICRTIIDEVKFVPSFVIVRVDTTGWLHWLSLLLLLLLLGFS